MRGAGEARRRAGFNRALVPGGGGGATASGLQLGGAETVAGAVWWVAAEAGVDSVVGECGGWGGRARANVDEGCMQLHAKQFHAAAGALLERRTGDVRVVVSSVGLLRNMSGRYAAMHAVCGEMWQVTRVVGSSGGADGRGRGGWIRAWRRCSAGWWAGCACGAGTWRTGALETGRSRW